MNPQSSRTKWRLRLIRSVSTTIAFAGLAFAGWWGVAHDWDMGRPQHSGELRPWCAEHNVPDDICVECKPGLMPKGKSFGWCRLHGVSECPTCHPELAQVNEKVKLPQYDTLAAIRALPRVANDKSCETHKRRIQFEDDAAVKKAGLDIAVVGEGPMGEYVTANAEAAFDPSRVARISSPVSGRVVFVAKRLGEAVKPGELLAIVDAADVGKAKTELLQAIAQKQLRAKSLDALKSAVGTVPEVRLREAEAAVAEGDVRILAAEQALANYGMAAKAKTFDTLTIEAAAVRLRTLGFTEALAESLSASNNLLPLRAPAGGSIVTRDVVPGEVVDASKVLMVVADAAKLMLTLHVREEDAKFLKPGQTAQFDDSQGARLAAGTVGTLSTSIDDKTRTLPVRVMLDNPQGLIRNNTFGTGRVVLREEPNAVILPTSAVHWDGTCHIIFVRDKHYLDPGAYKVFHVRKVVPGAKSETFTEILAGALPGEVVVTKGSAALRAELLKNSLGEG